MFERYRSHMTEMFTCHTWPLQVVCNGNASVWTQDIRDLGGATKRSRASWNILCLSLILLMEDIPNNHLGCFFPSNKGMNYLSSGAGFFKPSIVVARCGQWVFKILSGMTTCSDISLIIPLIPSYSEFALGMECICSPAVSFSWQES